MKLSSAPFGRSLPIASIHGRGSFRRRLLELGLLPGTEVVLLGVAPLGDPLRLMARGALLSLRRQDADAIEVTDPTESEPEAESTSIRRAGQRLRSAG